MDVRQLRYFLGVLEAQSITKAAQSLNVAQPALGLQIRKLEEELGVTLVERHSRGISPTAAGRVLQAHARTLIRQFERARQDLIDYGREPRGDVSVGLTTTAAMMLVGPLVRQCQKRYPQVRLSITESLSETLIEWAKSDRLDIVLTFNQGTGNELDVEPLIEESLHFIAPASVGPLDPAGLPLEDALESPLLLPSRPHGLRLIVERAAKDISAALHVAMEIDSVAAIIELIQDGIGCTTLPQAAGRRGVEAGRLVSVPIIKPEIKRTMYLAIPRNRTVSKAQEAVAGVIRETLRQIVRQGDTTWRLKMPEGAAVPPPDRDAV